MTEMSPFMFYGPNGWEVAPVWEEGIQVGPESIGNKLALGSDGPRIQRCTNVKTCGHTLKRSQIQHQAQQKKKVKSD